MRAILTYHSIDSSGSPISVSRAAFARHVAWLASGRVRVTTVDELLGLPDTVDAVALTFDDGFRNFGEVASPMLAAHGLPSTVFVVSDRVGGTNAWRGVSERVTDPGIPILPLLDWGELESLSERGVTLGAHTRTHARLDALHTDRLVDEICGSAMVIRDRTGRVPSGFAYPYGSLNQEAADVVRRTFVWGCTTELRLLGAADQLATLPRLDMYYFRDPGRLESWGTARFSYYLTLRAHARRFRQRFATSHPAP
jgi:peptidoglycan/xylan/chitin deacetylase (PgdA/CDA1 family)